MTTADEVGSITITSGEHVYVRRQSLADSLDHLPDTAFDDAVIVSTRGHPDDIEARVESAGRDPADVSVVPVTGSAIRYDGPLKVRDRTGPNDLTGVGVRVMEAVDSSSAPWVIFDNVNVFMMYADEQRVYRFLDTLAGKIRARDGRGVYFSVGDAISESTEEKLKQVTDRTIDGTELDA